MLQLDTQKGFIALVSVLMVSVLLLVSVIALAQYSMSSRYALLLLEHKTETAALANACAEIARIAIVNDVLYETTNKAISVDERTCVIERIFAHTPSSDYSRIEVSATVEGAITNLRVEVVAVTGVVTKREEVTDF